jgi:arylsulfatase A-like enzyme
LAAVTLSAPGAPAAERPNVLLILADDLGFSDLGCYGGEIATPSLDKLAADGLRFRQFYNCARCCPTRASLLTGLYPHQAGVGDMTGDAGFPGYRGFPQPNTATIAEVLRTAGYHTSMVGKWHLGGPKRPSPVDRGFDEFYGMIGGFNSCFQEDPFYTRLPAGRKKREYAKDGFYSTDAFGDYALDFLALARKEKKPFFQYLAFNAPHFPLHAKPDDIKKYADAYAIGWDELRAARHEADRARPVPEGHAALTAVPVHHPPGLPAVGGEPGVGRARRRPQGRSRAPHGGLRRDGRVHGPQHRPRDRRPAEERRTRQHARPVPQRQRGVRRVGPVRVRREQRAEERAPQG